VAGLQVGGAALRGLDELEVDQRMFVQFEGRRQRRQHLVSLEVTPKRTSDGKKEKKRKKRTRRRKKDMGDNRESKQQREEGEKRKDKEEDEKKKGDGRQPRE
jgi:hypothetical protein